MTLEEKYAALQAELSALWFNGLQDGTHTYGYKDEVRATELQREQETLKQTVAGKAYSIASEECALLVKEYVKIAKEAEAVQAKIARNQAESAVALHVKRLCGSVEV